MRYFHSATMLTSEDQRRILSMVNELKDTIEALLEMRNVMQDTYIPPLKPERTFQEERAAVKRETSTPDDL